MSLPETKQGLPAVAQVDRLVAAARRAERLAALQAELDALEAEVGERELEHAVPDYESVCSFMAALLAQDGMFELLCEVTPEYTTSEARSKAKEIENTRKLAAMFPGTPEPKSGIARFFSRASDVDEAAVEKAARKLALETTTRVALLAEIDVSGMLGRRFFLSDAGDLLVQPYAHNSILRAACLRSDDRRDFHRSHPQAIHPFSAEDLVLPDPVVSGDVASLLIRGTQEQIEKALARRQQTADRKISALSSREARLRS